MAWLSKFSYPFWRILWKRSKAKRENLLPQPYTHKGQAAVGQLRREKTCPYLALCTPFYEKPQTIELVSPPFLLLTHLGCWPNLHISPSNQISPARNDISPNKTVQHAKVCKIILYWFLPKLQKYLSEIFLSHEFRLERNIFPIKCQSSMFMRSNFRDKQSIKIHSEQGFNKMPFYVHATQFSLIIHLNPLKTTFIEAWKTIIFFLKIFSTFSYYIFDFFFFSQYCWSFVSSSNVKRDIWKFVPDRKSNNRETKNFTAERNEAPHQTKLHWKWSSSPNKNNVENKAPTK